MVPSSDAVVHVDEEETSSNSLYENLQSFRDFNDLSRDQHYIRIPSEWWVLTADVVDKTAAIEAGLYRDVNTIGAASVTGVKNALSTSIKDFPYVFTGDGATMIVPPRDVETALAALVALRQLVETNFKMQLRVGSVEVRDLEDAGGCVEVAKYEIAPGMNIAIFRGGGLKLADERIRKEGSVSVVGDLEEEKATTTAAETDTLASTNSRVAASSKVDLDTLMCRWEKIPNKQGCVMTLLVYDNPNVQGNVYDEVLAEIEEILNPTIMAASSKKLNVGNPVIVEHLEFQSIGEILAHERRFYTSRFNIRYMLRAAEVVLVYIIFRLHMIQRLIINGPHYKAAQRTYADHRKFDDMLRMVIDCTKDQANAIEFMLQDKYNHGLRLFYGVHYSSHTIMTCLVEGTDDGQHVHFVDGDEGGYAMAAKTLRKQLNDAATNDFSTNFCLHETNLSSIIMDNDEDGKSVEMMFDHHHRMDGGDATIGGTNSIEEDPFSMEAFGTIEECGIDTFFRQSDRSNPHSYHGGVQNELSSSLIKGVSDHGEETPHLEAVSDGEASPLAIPMSMDDGVVHVPPSSLTLDPEFDVEQPAIPLHSLPKKKKKKKKDDDGGKKKKKKKSKKKKSSKESSSQFHDSVGCTANSTLSGGTDLEWGTASSTCASHASIASSSVITRKSSHPFEPSATAPAWTAGAAWGNMSTSPDADETVEGWTAEATAWEDTDWGTASSFRKASVA